MRSNAKGLGVLLLLLPSTHQLMVSTPTGLPRLAHRPPAPRVPTVKLLANKLLANRQLAALQAGLTPREMASLAELKQRGEAVSQDIRGLAVVSAWLLFALHTLHSLHALHSRAVPAKAFLFLGYNQLVAGSVSLMSGRHQGSGLAAAGRRMCPSRACRLYSFGWSAWACHEACVAKVYAGKFRTIPTPILSPLNRRTSRDVRRHHGRLSVRIPVATACYSACLDAYALGALLGAQLAHLGARASASSRRLLHTCGRRAKCGALAVSHAWSSAAAAAWCQSVQTLQAVLACPPICHAHTHLRLVLLPIAFQACVRARAAACEVGSKAVRRASRVRSWARQERLVLQLRARVHWQR